MAIGEAVDIDLLAIYGMTNLPGSNSALNTAQSAWNQDFQPTINAIQQGVTHPDQVISALYNGVQQWSDQLEKIDESGNPFEEGRYITYPIGYAGGTIATAVAAGGVLKAASEIEIGGSIDAALGKSSTSLTSTPGTSLIPYETPGTSLIPTPGTSLVPYETPGTSLIPTPGTSLVPYEPPGTSLIPYEQPGTSLIPYEPPGTSLIPYEPPGTSLIPTPGTSLIPTEDGWPLNRGFLGTPETVTLQPGTLIDRYGMEGGTFAAPVGTPFPMRSLPLDTLSQPYNVYEVVQPISDVKSGLTAPWFGQPGLGIQYELSNPIEELINSGQLRRVGG